MRTSVVHCGISSLIRSGSFIIPHALLPLRASRSASVASAIGRGLRRSQGVGFRGRERSIVRTDDDTRKDSTARNGRSSSFRNSTRATGSMTSDRQEFKGGSFGRERTPDRKSTTDSRDARIRRGKKDVSEDSGRRPKRLSITQKFYEQYSDLERKERGRSNYSRQDAEVNSEPGNARRSGRGSPRTGGSTSNRHFNGVDTSNLTQDNTRPRSSVRVHRQPTGQYEVSEHRRTDGQFSLKDADSQARAFGRRKVMAARSTSSRRSDHQDDAGDQGSGETQPRRMHRSIPISVPYTTPASEFLYGTSVVQAALRAHRRVGATSRPSGRGGSRSLYKLYIYSGENRQSTERDAGLEQLARLARVPLVHVATADGLRMMDKMSSGRPHNGYILEASPLPQLPVTSLGAVIASGGGGGGEQLAFEVALDHQSREEAAVNGSTNVIRVGPGGGGGGSSSSSSSSSSKGRSRQPFVLLLDSIIDPGNLGGILRTASFLGASAVAISARNCAPFSPVVFKASAGASEHVTLLSVRNTAGFVADSQAAGWKVFAAVAPSGDEASTARQRRRQQQQQQERTTTAATTTTTTTVDAMDELGHDPLSEAPCLLMLGSEGEGLRSHLRRRADVLLSIGGAGSGDVDSLNVSVAAGILCGAFLRRRRQPQSLGTDAVRQEEQNEERQSLFALG